MMKRLYDYTVVLRPDDNGTFVAFVPAIPGCHAWGQTPEEAQAELLNVFDMIRDEYKEEGPELRDSVSRIHAIFQARSDGDTCAHSGRGDPP